MTVIAELDSYRVEILSGERCKDAANNRHFRFWFCYLDSIPDGLISLGIEVGDRLWDCCQPGHFKHWRRE